MTRGRPLPITNRDSIRRLADQGYSQVVVARILGLARMTVRKYWPKNFAQV